MRRLLCVLIMCLVASAAVFADKCEQIVLTAISSTEEMAMFTYQKGEVPEDDFIECCSNYLFDGQDNLSLRTDAKGNSEPAFVEMYCEYISYLGAYIAQGGNFHNTVICGKTIITAYKIEYVPGVAIRIVDN